MAVKGAPVKYKGVFVVCKVAGGWSGFWNAWDWATIKRSIDYAASQGFNSVMITASGIADSATPYPSMALMQARITQLCQYCQGLGMVMIPQLGYQPQNNFGASGANVAANTAVTVQIAAMFAAQPNVAMIDALNEVNLSWPSSWSGPSGQSIADLTYYVGQIRLATGNIPLSLSVACGSVAEISGAWMQAVAPLVDVHNIHTYYYAEGVPTAAQTNALVAAPWFRGAFVVGESGMPVGGAYSTAQQTAWLAGNAAMAARAECLGTVLYCDTATSYNDFGLLDVTATTPRAQVVSGVSSWPANLWPIG
jgi:hypothetical protein